jgi:hypothetical protein
MTASPQGIRNRVLRATFVFALVLHSGFCSGTESASIKPVLKAESFKHYFVGFARDEKQMLGDSPPLPWEWFEANIPLLDIPDKEIEETYYFRWYAFQKHIVRTPHGFVIDEFLDQVPWAGKFNTIDAAAGHHIREARWLRDSRYADDYARFWFGPDGEPRRYSFWAADSVYQLYLATGDSQLAVRLLPYLEKNYEAWEATHQDENGLYWQIDDRDGMEISISGTGYRPTIDSYMYGDAVAISQIAEIAGEVETSVAYKTKADRLRSLIERQLWNPQDHFYETVQRHTPSDWIGGRELIGYLPWYFNIPAPDHQAAWKYLFDPGGFDGRFGPTTAERRNPRFGFSNPHECLWNGPSWPFATTQTLVALANLLNEPGHSTETTSDYMRLLSTYAKSQRIELPGGKSIRWIDENLDADSGKWIARSILTARKQAPANRGRYYNHSGFADLIITGLIGLRPMKGNEVVLNPLIPKDQWGYFALDDVPYHGHLLTILYDKDGSRYHRGTGLQIFCDGKVIAHAPLVQVLHARIPDSAKLQAVVSTNDSTDRR